MTKVVSLSDEAYRTLKILKGMKSFSEIVLEMARERASKRRNIMEFAGIWEDNADEWEQIKNKIYEDRKKAKTREVVF